MTAGEAIAGTLEIGGGHLETLDVPATGEPKRAPLLLLHEGLGSIDLWKDLPRALGKRTGRRVLAYSRRGHGASSPLEAPRTPAFMHDEARDVVPALLDAFDIGRDPDTPGVVLVGHSDGASIALLHAAWPDRDPRTRAVVALAPHVFVEQMCVDAIADLGRKYPTSGLGPRLGKYHRDPDHTFWAWNDLWLDPAFRDWNVEAELPGITAPVLVIQGRQDEYGTAAQLEAVHRGTAGPCDVLFLDRCGHAPHRDRPDLVLAIIAAFLEAAA